jgi:hypothetical protein
MIELALNRRSGVARAADVAQRWSGCFRAADGLGGWKAALRLVVRNARAAERRRLKIGPAIAGADWKICATRKWEEPMWFQRKPKNRAFERRHVLDVKGRAPTGAAHARRVATLAASLSLGTIFALYLLWRCGDWGMTISCTRTKAFAIQDIDIQTDGVMAVEQLRRWCGVKREQIFSRSI